MTAALKKKITLQPDRHPQLDFFVSDVLTFSPKSDQHTLEHPFFSLSKRPDKEVRYYEHNGNSITITPSVKGIATIWDKDILIFAVSVMREAMNRGETFEENRPINITAYNLLVTTNRNTSGRGYSDLVDAFDRLRGTGIKTDITTNGIRVREGFGLIESWKVIEASPKNQRMVAIQIKLSDWLFNAIKNGHKELLTLNRDYFRLSGGLERRIYELARKHCGEQGKWAISMELLHKKSGSKSPLKRFRFEAKKIIEANELPDYILTFDQDKDQVTFYSKNYRKEIKGLIGQAEPPTK